MLRIVQQQILFLMLALSSSLVLKRGLYFQVDQAAKTPAKDNLSISMAQGVPLPLAIKGLEEDKAKEKEESKKVGREILEKSADTPEQREKRDLEALEKEDNLGKRKTSEDSIKTFKTDSVPIGESSSNDVIDAKFKLVKTDNVVLLEKSKEQLALSKDALVQLEPAKTNSNKETAVIESQGVADVELLPNPDDVLCKEPCQKNLLKSALKIKKSSKDDDIEKAEEEEECPKATAKTKEAPTASLIKVPQKLTNEHPILPENADFPRLKEQAAIIGNRIGKQKK